MSKMDGLRAMREARYAERTARAAGPVAKAATKPTSTTASKPAAKPAGVAPDEPQPTERLCGHRAISGRTCTREHGHTAKSHRYS